MGRHLSFALILFFIVTALCFGQAGALRDYVGLISIRYHPDVIAYMGKFRDTFEKRGQTSAAKAVDNYLKGLSGSGFIYVAPDGTNYVLTNEHVVAQSDSLSITFEKLDGAKITYDRLKVFRVDEEKDLALLVFDEGVKPFTRGLSFSKTQAEEGSDVFAAGFPGLGNAAIWQFSKGTVSNAAARIPKSSDETIGPYIQHTAQIDPGNSGGPLLVAVQGVPTGYAVVGINTMSAYFRQATNYAIPITQVQAFIDTALSKAPVDEQGLIAQRVDDFIKGLRVNKAVYGHIAGFLSNNCSAANAEYSISELVDKAPQTVQNNFFEAFGNDPADGMNIAVAWNIENSMRAKSVSIKIALDSISPNAQGGFDVAFNVNDAIVKSGWIKEYGIWRLDTWGDINGSKTLLENKKKAQQQNKDLVTDYTFTISAGYAHIFAPKNDTEKNSHNIPVSYYSADSGIVVSMRFNSPFSFGLDAIVGFGTGYLQIGPSFGYAWPIRIKSFALIPYGELGLTYMSSKKRRDAFNDVSATPFNLAFTAKGGMMVTFAKVPGLFGSVFYQHIIPPIELNRNHGNIGIAIGYGM